MRGLESSLFWGLCPSLPGIFTGLHKEVEYLKQMLRHKNNVTSVNKKNTDWKGYDGGCGQVCFVFEDYYVKAYWLLFASTKGTTKLETALLWGSLHTSLHFPDKNSGPDFGKMDERNSVLPHLSANKNHSFLLLGPVHYAFYLKDILTLEGTDILACLL